MVVAHHIFIAVTHIYGRLKYLNPLLGKLGASHTAYQLLGLA